MADLLDRLVVSGAPEVHEPYLYRVAPEWRAEAPEGSVRVELRRRNAYQGTRRLGSFTIAPNDDGVLLPGVVEACRTLVAEYIPQAAGAPLEACS